MGPSMVSFLKEVYCRAEGADKFLISQQPALKYSWNTMAVSSFWDMRLGIACAATDAEFQTASFLHDNTPSTSMSWRGSPTLTPTMCHTRRRASSPLPEGA